MEATYQELLSQIEALQSQAAAVREQEIAAVLANVRQTIKDYNLSERDVFPKQKRGPAGGFSVAPKYRHPVSGQTWTGRGKTPAWVVDALASGYTLEALLIPTV